MAVMIEAGPELNRLLDILERVALDERTPAPAQAAHKAHSVQAAAGAGARMGATAPKMAHAARKQARA